MNRARQVASFWAWLPAFRVVAETEHLPTASRTLHVAPSALSRTIRLLEEELGHKLFDRTGRRITLNAKGDLLLQSTRNAMRLVDEVTQQLAGKDQTPAFHIASAGPFVPLYVLPVLKTLQTMHPGLRCELHSLSSSEINEALRQGTIDAAILDDPTPDLHLRLERLKELEHDVFVAAQKPPSRLQDLSFVAPAQDDRGFTPDAWPYGMERKVELRVQRMQVALDAVGSDEYAAVFPVDVGRYHNLTPLGVSAQMGRTELFVTTRAPLPEIMTIADTFCKLIQERMSP